MEAIYSITLYGNDQQIYSGGCGNGVCVNYTAVTILMVILLILLGIHRQSLVEQSFSQSVKCIDVV